MCLDPNRSFKICFILSIKGTSSRFIKNFIFKAFERKIRKLFFIKAIFLDFINILNKKDLLLPSNTITLLKFTFFKEKKS